MARKRFGVELGFDIYDENGNSAVSWLVGDAAPTGTGDQASAAIGSLYQRRGTGELYIKKTNVGDASDYVLISLGFSRWRREQVDIVTNDTIAIGTRDVVLNPPSDEDGTPSAANYTVGHYVISDADGTPTLLEITNKVGDDVTFAAAATALVDGDSFVTKKYLPDQPANQENSALVVYSDAVIVKIADVDWNFATGIQFSSSYSSSGVNGNISAGESIESGVQKLEGNQQDIQSTIGVAQGSVNMGSYTGTLLNDNETAKQNIQQLETAIEGNDDDIANLVSLSGRPVDSTDHGTMDQGDILSDAATTNALFKETDAELTRQRGKTSATGITAGFVTLDSVLVDEVSLAQWNITVQQNGTPANKQHFTLLAGHDGSADGVTDAAAVDSTKSKILKLGATFNVQVQVVLSGTGVAQEMQLQFNSTDTIDVYAKRIETLY